jgi:putative glycosyltransferase (TIGR04348 family)
MKILLVTPAPRGSTKGNRITAVRWARIIRQLGHSVLLDTEYRGQACEALIALHAVKSSASVQRFRRERPEAPMVVALAGTDMTRDLRPLPAARQTVRAATRLIVLQPSGRDALAADERAKTRIIVQSATAPCDQVRRSGRQFDVCVLGHLRPVKDPLRTAHAARALPSQSRIRILHIGAALSPEMRQQAVREVERNPRYHWLGELPHWKAVGTLARCRLLVHTSRHEGGPSALSEAIAAGVPILSTTIPAVVAVMGRDYPGLFPVAQTRALTRLLLRAETDGRFYDSLDRWCRSLKPLVDPEREINAWRSLLDELGQFLRI